MQKKGTLYHSIKAIHLFSFLILTTSCKDHNHKIQLDSPPTHVVENTPKESKPISYFHISKDSLDNNIYYNDTVTAKTSEEFVHLIKSNRLIRLLNKEYILHSSPTDKNALAIDGIKNLKIVGKLNTKLLAYERTVTALKFSNSYNIHLDSLIIGHTKIPDRICEQGVLKINHSYNFNITNCKLMGPGTFGLITNDVYKLNFLNSEITECTAMIFELEKSRKFTFTNSKFHHNNLSTSVLGAFTYDTKEISFSYCRFINNVPKSIGNPAFNFLDNYKKLDELILFESCIFKNNKGFKWYGDKIKLSNCQIDSSGFIGL